MKQRISKNTKVIDQAGSIKRLYFSSHRFRRAPSASQYRPDSTRVTKHEPGYEKFDFHSLRHTHATKLSEADVNVKKIQRRLGHSTMEMTSKRYLHATKAMEDENIEKMIAMFADR